MNVSAAAAHLYNVSYLREENIMQRVCTTHNNYILSGTDQWFTACGAGQRCDFGCRYGLSSA